MGYLKNELSKKSRYYLSRDRYLELKHFCLQYDEWRSRLLEINDISAKDLVIAGSDRLSNETERIALERTVLKNKIDLVERTAMDADKSLWYYILKGVTEERTYIYLVNMMNIPCGKNMYYDRYRKFFWLLDKKRD